MFKVERDLIVEVVNSLRFQGEVVVVESGVVSKHQVRWVGCKFIKYAENEEKTRMEPSHHIYALVALRWPAHLG